MASEYRGKVWLNSGYQLALATPESNVNADGHNARGNFNADGHRRQLRSGVACIFLFMRHMGGGGFHMNRHVLNHLRFFLDCAYCYQVSGFFLIKRTIGLFLHLRFIRMLCMVFAQTRN